MLDSDVAKLYNCETNENATMTVYKQDETQLDKNELVCTGMTLVIKLEQKEIRLTIAVMGDVDGDAEITVNDLAKMKLHLIGSQLLSEISLIAAYIDDEEGLTINDIAKVKFVLLDLLEI